MTDEKELDRQVNVIYVEYRKYQEESTCPFCNLDSILREAFFYQYDENKKLVKQDLIHDPDNCLRRHATLVLAVHKDSNGKYLPPEALENLIEEGLRKLKAMDRQFTEGKK